MASNTNFPNVFPSTDPEAETQDITTLATTDATFTIKDNSDPTKIVAFQASGITTGTTRTMTIPDANDTLAVLSLAQTMTGKTMTVTTSKCTSNVGTANTGTTAVEFGDGYNHVTVLTVSTTLPAIAGGANLGVGKLLYTLPAGVQILEASYMTIGITQTQGNINADTPEVGLGTVIASGAVATLDGTATFEDILTGQVAANCTGTATVATLLATSSPFVVIRNAAAAKTIYLNVADGWAASGDAAALLAGTVTLVWKTLA